MKLTLFLLCLIPIIVSGQDTISFMKEINAIAEMEKQSASARTTKELSGASHNFDVHHYRCQWHIDPNVLFISGSVTPAFTMVQTGNTISLDMQKALVVDSIVYHNNSIPYDHHGDTLTILFPANINAGTKDSVSIYYHGVPVFTGLGAFYQHTHAGAPVIWTLSQPFGAKYWWPCKDGLGDKADSLDILITHPAIYTASSNGMVVSKVVDNALATTHFRHRYPIASYLVAVAVTNYLVDDDTISVGNKSYRFISYSYPESAAGFFGQEQYAKDAFRTFTKLYGEYPFASEKYGHTQIGRAVGMEHQTNSFMYHTSPTLSAHELAHQWFGDKVTCGSWSDIWVNEGITTYSAGLYIRENFDPMFYRTFLQETLNSVVSQPGGSVYVADTVNGSIFSTRLSYNKGAFVTHMLRWVLGDSTFFRGLRRYLNDPALAYGFARTADLQRNLEQESGKNLTSFFQKWIYGEGYPNYQANWSQNANHWAKVKLNQTTSHPSVSFYDMPVMLEFRSAARTERVVVDHRYSGQEFNIKLDFEADTLVIDPDLWILSKTKTTQKLPSSTGADIIHIYPNPAPNNATLTLENPTGSRLFVRLFSSTGQLLYRKDLATAGQNEIIDLGINKFPRGVY
ncbi:MAG TPA: M1 family aminopeptidase, partial [Chitinophagaceae bacterium]|nr:M1 family aminopeptidase [Chitinophagaceae bacterium]